MHLLSTHIGADTRDWNNNRCGIRQRICGPKASAVINASHQPVGQTNQYLRVIGADP